MFRTYDIGYWSADSLSRIVCIGETLTLRIDNEETRAVLRGLQLLLPYPMEMEQQFGQAIESFASVYP